MNNILKGHLILVRLILLTASMVLLAAGIATIYSLGNPAEVNPSHEKQALADKWQKQAQYAVFGLVCFVAVNLLNYRRLGAWSYGLYAAVLGLLAVLLVSKYITELSFAPEINGTYRWIKFRIAGFELPALQPSELCKLSYILALSWYLRYRSNYRHFKALVGPFVLTVLPIVLILLEPDLGTVMLMMPILFVMLFVAGAKVKHLAIIIVMAVLVSPLLWQRIEPYQRSRISGVFFQSQWIREKVQEHPRLSEALIGKNFNPTQWQRGEGYQLIRSKYAIASGGTAGYGFRHGPFVKYNFLPFRDNDFIFASIAHQWGFRGGAVVLGLYVLIIGCGIEIASRKGDPFGRLLAVGISAMFAVEVFINVAMTLGLMPITGLTLPLVSYGGSSLMVHMTCVGLLNNVGRCRPFSLSRKSFE